MSDRKKFLGRQLINYTCSVVAFLYIISIFIEPTINVRLGYHTWNNNIFMHFSGRMVKPPIFCNIAISSPPNDFARTNLKNFLFDVFEAILLELSDAPPQNVLD